ncbi:hypothetical protein [Geobacter argillaceus]|uniref:Uncharacterized protein n=1 Tax=Geobacter argillaceus TaxID=345631 RepID=A0A562WS22_9BACT|nr:hypothetical protein [Geobacter argillaceus]TWJ32970.1 hypothetical protein JN12_00381 [Geobacter argillaceus]
MSAASLAVLTGALFLAAAPDFGEIEQHIDPQLAASIERIEIVNVNGTFSHIEYQTTPNPIIPVTPPLSGYTIIDPKLIPFGPCPVNGPELSRPDNRPCGFLLDLGQKTTALNVLPFDRLELVGNVTGSWQIAMADTNLALKEDNIPFARLETGGPFSLPLPAPTGRLDPTRARQFVFILTSRHGSLDMRQIRLHRNERIPANNIRGIWLWDRRKIIDSGKEVINELVSRDINRVYIQIHDHPGELIPFLLAAGQAGIAVYALDGSPSYVNAPEKLLQRLGAVLAHNRAHPEAPFAGFQIDVEPYLLKDFNLKRDIYAARFTTLISSLRKHAAGALPVSVVIPLWFDQVPAGDRSLAQRTVAEADEVVVMAYRTTLDAIVNSAVTTLAWGERLGKPVLLGIELSRLPDEEHRVLEKSHQGGTGTVLLGGTRWRERQSYRVYGGNLSFAGKQHELGAILEHPPPFSSFAGWVLHDYEALDR